MQNTKQLTEKEMQQKGRKVFLLMLTFFIVPIVVVILMFKLNWKPSGASLGELVTPPRLLNTPTELKTNDAKQVMPQLWKEKWSIVYVAAECEKACLDKLHDMRQLHVSLYKDIERTQRVLITTAADVSQIKHAYPDLIVINQPVADVVNLSQQFQINGDNVTSGNRLYLVDPLGHLMMSYQPSVPLADVRKDVTRLLRYSWAG
jgi:cytochrome oxidase Cu insertion factor (SCO1/SenC/PrrC family)